MATGNTVILGAGIIGTSTAYYLSESGRTPASSIHLVDASPRMFASASGYAGGFLARDWFSPAVASLGALSFDLHRQLAAQHGGRERWGYSRCTGMSTVESDGKRGEDWLREGTSRAGASAVHELRDEDSRPAWFTKSVESGRVETISKDDNVAQVDPLRLCEFLLSEVQKRGANVYYPAKALSVSKDMRGELAAVRIARDDGEEIDLPCTRLVITAGAWSPQVFSELFPASPTRIPVSPYAGHSLVVRSPRWTSEDEARGCHAVFCTDPSGHSPEIFSRIGGEIYVAGINSTEIPLPRLATDSRPLREPMDLLKGVAKRHLGLSGADDLHVVREALCFRPVTAKGPPLVCRVADSLLGDMKTRGAGDGGVFLSAGHGPWGISQSLGTGKVLSELVEGQQPSADIRHLSM